MIPLAAGGVWGFYQMFYPERNPDRVVYHNSFGSGVEWNVALSADGRKVLGAATWGDPAADFLNFPAPYNDPEFVYGHFAKAALWSKYAGRDPISLKNGGDFLVSGKAAAALGKIGSFSETRKRLKDAIPKADLEYFVYGSECARKMEQRCIGTDFKAWNNIVVPVISKNPDKVMKFFDWLFSAPANHDLFELGIEGKHWTAAGKEEFKQTPESSRYIFPAYELTWQPTLSRMNSDIDEDLKRVYKYEANLDTYYRLPLSDFVFDTEPVKMEIAKVAPKWAAVNQILKNGVIKDWEAEASTTNKEMRALGFDLIRKELLKQIQVYLDGGGR